MALFPASHLDLLEAQSFGVLATIAPSGHPQATAVAYLTRIRRSRRRPAQSTTPTSPSMTVRVSSVSL